MSDNQIRKKENAELFDSQNNVFGQVKPILTQEQQQDLALHISKKKVDLDAKQNEIEINHIVAQVEMKQALQTIEVLDKTTKDDYKYNQKFQTGSGDANIQVERNRNQSSIILAALCLAVIAFFIMVLMFKK